MSRQKRTQKKSARRAKMAELEEEDQLDWSAEGIDRIIEDTVEKLLEERSSTRIAAIRNLSKALSFKYSYDLVSQHKNAISDALLRSLKGKDQEHLLAAHALSMTTVTLGADSETFYSTFAPCLTNSIKNTILSPEIRSANITALALTCFIACTNEIHTYNHEQLFSTLIQNSELDAEIHTAALRGWTLLLTTLPSSFIQRDSFPKHLPVISPLLDSPNLDLRIAAGETLAFLFGVMREIHENAKGESEEFNYKKINGTNEKAIEEVMERLEEKVNQNLRWIGKKDRNAQRASFREVVRAIETGEIPAEKIRCTSGNEIEFDTWQKWIQYHFLRDLLGEHSGGGLQVHFEENDLLKEIFEVDEASDELEGTQKKKLTKIEKRMWKSPNSPASKERTRVRAKDRQRHGRDVSRMYDKEENGNSEGKEELSEF